MTDPKDIPPKWPTGLKKILEQYGAKSLVEAVRKKTKPKEKPAMRLPYKDVDSEAEPD